MKFKALRTIREPKEFVEISFHESDVDPNTGVWIVYTGALPNPQPETATVELMKAYYAHQTVPLPPEINLDDYELVEFDCIESGVIGADIRNKVTPLLNLIALCDIILKDEHPEKKEVIKSLLKKEMETSKICIKYLVKLL
jgi:hypothetical protein